jgi:hypothetical protein
VLPGMKINENGRNGKKGGKEDEGREKLVGSRE